MVDFITGASAAERAASELGLPADRAASNGLSAVDGRRSRRERMAKWLEDALELQSRIRAERGDSAPMDSASLINELREERVGQRFSAAGRPRGK